MGKDYHAKGQKDASKRKYQPPHGVFDDLTTWSSSGMERNAKENKEYNKGYKHGKQQRR